MNPKRVLALQPRLWPFALAVAFTAAVTVAGCVSAPEPINSIFDVNWDLMYVGDGVEAPCDVEGMVVDVDLLGAADGVTSHFTFACEKYHGKTGVLPPQVYTASLRLRRADGTLLSEVPPLDYQILPHGVTSLGTYQDPIVFDIQSFEFNWAVYENVAVQGSIPVTCQAAGASTARFIYQGGKEPAVTIDYACAAKRGFSSAILPGTYGVTAQLLAPSGKILDNQTNTVVVDAVNRARLSPVPFTVQQ